MEPRTSIFSHIAMIILFNWSCREKYHSMTKHPFLPIRNLYEPDQVYPLFLIIYVKKKLATNTQKFIAEPR